MWTVQEGGRYGCSQAHTAEFRKLAWKLFVRQNICSGSCQDQSSTRACGLYVDSQITEHGQAKFNKDELYRRPEFADPKPALPSEPPPPPALAQHPQAGPSNPGPTREENPPAKPESASEQAEKPIAYIPRHLRQDVAPSTIQQATSLKEGFSVQRTKEPPLAANRPGAQQPTGLHTPIQTPAQRIPAQARRHNEQSPLARQQPQKRREISAEAAEGEYDSPVDLPSLGGEENYGLNSEDDAFLAAVDLGDGDLGRPIDFEEGIGGVSVMDDSSLDQEQSTRSAVAKSPVIQHPRVNVDSATRSSESSAQIRRAVTLPNRGTTGRVDSGSSSSSSAASNAVGAASAVSTTSGLPGRHPGALKVTHTTSGNVSILSQECHPCLNCHRGHQCNRYCRNLRYHHRLSARRTIELYLRPLG